MNNPIVQDVTSVPAPATRNFSMPIAQHPKHHQQWRSAGVRVHRQRRRRFAQVWNARWRHGGWSIDLHQGCRWLGYLKSIGLVTLKEEGILYFDARMGLITHLQPYRPSLVALDHPLSRISSPNHSGGSKAASPQMHRFHDKAYHTFASAT